jgi:hypothetical protein
MSYYNPYIKGSHLVTNGLISTFNSNTLGNLYTTGGNVGLNTTSPNFTLDVNGSINTNSFITASSIGVSSASIGTLYTTNYNPTNINPTNINVTNLTVNNLITSSFNPENMNITNLTVNSVISNSVNMANNSLYSGSFSALNNISNFSNITGLVFNSSSVVSFIANISIIINATTNVYETFTLIGSYSSSGWILNSTSSGDISGIVFNLHSSGQLQYTSTNVPGWSSTTMRFNINQTSLSGNYTSFSVPTFGNVYSFDNIVLTNASDSVVGGSSGALNIVGGASIGKSLLVGTLISSVNTILSGTISAATHIGTLVSSGSMGAGGITVGTLYATTVTSGSVVVSGTISAATHVGSLMSSGSIGVAGGTIGTLYATTITSSNVQVSGTISAATHVGTLVSSGSMGAGGVTVGTLYATTITSSNVQVSGTISAATHVGTLVSSGSMGAGGITVGTLYATTVTSGSVVVSGSISAATVVGTLISSATLNVGNATVNRIDVNGAGNSGSIWLNGTRFASDGTTSNLIMIGNNTVWSTDTSYNFNVSNRLSTGSMGAGGVTVGTIYATTVTSGSVVVSGTISAATIVGTLVSVGSMGAGGITTGTLYASSITCGNAQLSGTISASTHVGILVSSGSIGAAGATIGTLYANIITAANVQLSGTISANNLILNNGNFALTVNNPSPGSETSILYKNGSDANTSWYVGHNVAGISSGNFGFYNSARGTVVTILGTNGNVGVGTKQPQYTFDVTTGTINASSYTGGNVQLSGTVSAATHVGILVSAGSIGVAGATVGTLYANSITSANIYVSGSVVSVNVTSVNVIDTNITTSTLNVSTGVTTATLLVTSTISAGSLGTPGATIGTLYANSITGSNAQFSGTVSVDTLVAGTVTASNMGAQTISSGILYSTTVASSIVSTGKLYVGSSTLGSFIVTNGNSGIAGSNVIEFGYGVSGKEGNAGKIGYASFTANMLDILGGGTTGSYRTVKIWDGLTVGDITTNTLIVGTVTAGTVTASNMGAPTISTSTLYASSVISSANIQIPVGGTISSGTFVGSLISAGSIGIAGATVGTLYATSITAANAQVSGTVSAGTLRAGTLAATTVTTANVNAGYMTIGNFLVTSGGAAFGGSTMLEFGYGIAGKEINAGKIGYAAFTSALDIVGAGTTDRTVRIFDNLTVGGITTNTLIAGTVTAGTVTASNIGAPTVSAGTLAATTITSANVTSLNATTGNLLIKSGAGLLMNNGADAYNQVQLFNSGHDNLAINFDMYYPTTTASSKTASHTSYFQIQKASSQLNFNYGTSGAGSSGNLNVPLYRALSIDSSNGLVYGPYVSFGTLISKNVTIGTLSASLGQLPLYIYGTGDANHTLQYYASQDGPKLTGYGGGVLSAGLSGATDVLRWNASGIIIPGIVSTGNVISSNATISNLNVNNAGGAASATSFVMNTNADAYPNFQILNYQHDLISLNFDMYWNGAWTSSHASQFQIMKLSNLLQFNYGSVAAGSTFGSFNTAMSINTSGGIIVPGQITVGTLLSNTSTYVMNTSNSTYMSNNTSTDGGAFFYNHSNNNRVGITIDRDNTSQNGLVLLRMRNTANITTGQVVGNSSSHNGVGLAMSLTYNDNSTGFSNPGTGTVQACYMYYNGDINNKNNLYGGTSDVRLKENIIDARDYLDDLNRLRVVKYSFKDENSTIPTHLGLIAQEVEEIFPNLIMSSEHDTGIDENGEEFNVKTIKTSVINMMMLKAIQELTAKNDALLQRIEALENK